MAILAAHLNTTPGKTISEALPNTTLAKIILVAHLNTTPGKTILEAPPNTILDKTTLEGHLNTIQVSFLDCLKNRRTGTSLNSKRNLS